MEEPKLIKKNYKDIVKQKKVLIGMSIFVLIVLIAPSYALLSNFKKLEDAVNIKSANMNMGITQSSTISLEGKLPEADASGLENATPVSITVKNANTGPFTDTETTKFQNTSPSTMKIVKYELKLVPDTNQPSTLDNQYIKYAVSTDNGITYSTPMKVSDNNTIIFTGYNIDLGQTKNIQLKIWIDEDAGSNGTNKNYYGSIQVEMYQSIDIKSLPKSNAMTYIANHDTIKLDNIKFYEISGTENGNGLYLLPGTETNTYPIYYYRGDVGNNNVYFAGYCWKIVRTTETGGTKMIYNGPADITIENGQNVYNCGAREAQWTTTTSSLSLKGTKVYGSGYTPNDNGKYSLTGVQSITITSSDVNTKILDIIANYPYTCNLTSSTTCSMLYKVDSYDSGVNANVYRTKLLSYFDDSSVFNNYYNSPAYVGYSLPSSSHIYTSTYISLSYNQGVYYGKYVNTDGTLEDPQTKLDSTHHYSYNSTDPSATGMSDNSNNVRYYFYKSSSSDTSNATYITIDKTKSISMVLNEMLKDNTNVATNPSTIQSVINTWWSSLDNDYGNYLEDIKWCNDRSIGMLGGWNPDGGELYAKKSTSEVNLTFSSTVRVNHDSFYITNAKNIKNTNTPILTCSNNNDNLSVSNGNLTYPIGLLTVDELVLAGAVSSPYNSNCYLFNSSTVDHFWLLTPVIFGSYGSASVGRLSNGSIATGDISGSDNCRGVNCKSHVRPALSIASNINIIRGDGSYTNPYVITE